MLTLHRAAFLLPDPADPTAPSIADGAVVVRGELVEAVGPYEELTAAHPGARVRDWGAAVLAPGLRNPYGHWLLERAYHPDPREEVGLEPVADGLAGSTDETRCGASARRGLQRMLGYGVTAVAGPFERASVRTAVARSGVVGLPGSGSAGSGPSGSSGPGPTGSSGPGPTGSSGSSGGGVGPLDPLAVLPLAQAVYGRVAAGGRADFAVFAVAGGAGGAGAADVAGVGGAVDVEPAAGGCLATVLGGRLVYRRR
ncbi:imidazolonepropionase-like domain-containing protein [Kitasatospora sp. NPDC096204]|uniref:amidohydrolase family protein n=1 Tax=Kitasatospora sp. NPDC096204 TaxID=3364094 RepID=UPI0038230E37